ncbi:putative pectinesterase 53 [Cinnamomum micranthum f. kanehirae]|uniref:Pectinesterase n=1 Tax=Cinnamomum micranthum f. kanehirae TaxID=337451 RepID=A0A3S3N6I2_9MAGN|nr:putative pectinesterase 53 [Cinnamomum micranthum f. kanehirae]
MFLRLFLLILQLESRSSLVQCSGSQSVVVQEGYLKWIKQMSSLRHSVFQKAEKQKHKPCLTIKVEKKTGAGDFVSIQRAIDSIPEVNLCRVIISIGPGAYKEKVEIPATKAYISMEGAGAEKTVIEWDDTADRIGPKGRPLGTFGSATVAVNSPYFIAKNITFKVSVDDDVDVEHCTIAALRSIGKASSGTEDICRHCSICGVQVPWSPRHTLRPHGRHYFKECYIEGSIDFVFGDGLSLYDGCHLHAITNSYGALTAQKRESMLEESGFSFINCRVTGSGALYLGRAWGTFSRVVFAYTYMDKIITPRGWYNWGDKNREMTVFYGQYKCSGPGAEFGGRVSWSRELTSEEAKPFISLTFIDGQEWIKL